MDPESVFLHQRTGLFLRAFTPVADSEVFQQGRHQRLERSGFPRQSRRGSEWHKSLLDNWACRRFQKAPELSESVQGLISSGIVTQFNLLCPSQIVNHTHTQKTINE